MEILQRFVQHSKAESPISVTELGMEILLSFVQYWNAFLPIFLMEVGRWIFSMLENANSRSQISVLPSVMYISLDSDLFESFQVYFLSVIRFYLQQRTFCIDRPGNLQFAFLLCTCPYAGKTLVVRRHSPCDLKYL